jgi:predicted RNA binding protein YcfA (HicA-like mRNA interferase family)
MDSFVDHKPVEILKESRVVTVREVLRIIEDDGWILVSQKGSHRQYKHPTKTGRVTVAGHPKDDLAPGTLNSILRQAGLKD